jgi:hypothetical protein
MANKMHVLEGKKVGRRGAVHGAESSGELGWNSGERFPWIEGLPRAAEVSAGCARGRRSPRQDGAAHDETERPERRLW